MKYADYVFSIDFKYVTVVFQQKYIFNMFNNNNLFKI